MLQQICYTIEKNQKGSISTNNQKMKNNTLLWTLVFILVLILAIFLFRAQDTSNLTPEQQLIEQANREGFPLCTDLETLTIRRCPPGFDEFEADLNRIKNSSSEDQAEALEQLKKDRPDLFK